MRIVTAIVLTIGMLAMGCAKRPVSLVNGVPASPSAEKVVVLPTCPKGFGLEFAPAAAIAPIAAALVVKGAGIAIDKGSEAIATYLERRANDRIASSTASAHEWLYSPKTEKPTIGCIVFVRGKFGAKVADNPTEAKPWTKTELLTLHRLFGLVERPELYIAFRVDYDELSIPGAASTRSAYVRFMLTPVAIDYFVSGTAAGSKAGKQIDVTLSLEVRPLSGESTMILDQTLGFGQVKLGTSLRGADLAHKTIAPRPMPQRQEYAISYVQSGHLKEARVVDNLPVTVAVSVLESEDGGDVERAVADAVRKHASEIKDPLNAWLEAKVKAWLGNPGSTPAPAP